MSKPYLIYVSGCDDTTLTAVRLTDEQADAARLIAAEVTRASENGCQPDMKVVEATEIPDPKWDEDFDKPADYDFIEDYYNRATNTLYKPKEN